MNVVLSPSFTVLSDTDIPYAGAPPPVLVSLIVTALDVATIVPPVPLVLI